jgi:Beta-propeller repeat
VVKYAADGSFLWASQMVGSTGSSNIARCVTTDAKGNVFIGGDFTGAVSFGANTLTSGGAKDAFVAKLGPDGTVLWADRWGGVDKEYVEGVAVDGAGNVLTAGYTIRFNPDGSEVYCNLQVEKVSSTGTALWAKQIGNTNGGNEAAFGIGADTAGNVYVCGQFKGTVDFDPGPAKHNVQGAMNNGFVLKLTPVGDFGWVSPFISQNSTASNVCFDLAVDGSNNIVVGGDYRGSVDFDPGKSTSTLPYDVYSGTVFGGGFITKLNSAGSLIWAQPVGNGFVAVHSVALDSAGNVYAEGLFQGVDTGVTKPSDFDPGAGTNILTCNGATDVFVTKYSATGTYQWAVSFGGTGLDWSEGIAVDTAGNVYVAGYYSNTVDFNSDPLSAYPLTSAGKNDIFLLKLKQE